MDSTNPFNRTSKVVSYYYKAKSNLILRLEEFIIKEKYITIIGISYYYGIKPFSNCKRIKRIKEPSNPDAIKVTMKEIGTVG